MQANPRDWFQQIASTTMRYVPPICSPPSNGHHAAALHRILTLSLTWLLAWIALSPTSTAASDPPVLENLYPKALAPGQTTILEISGEHLTPDTQLWSSFSAASVPLFDTHPPNPNSRRFQVTVPLETAGLGAIRLHNLHGLSDIAWVLMDPLPTLKASGNIHSQDQAQSLQPPVAVEGRMGPLQSDWFHLDVQAGQTWSVDVRAQRLGSALDPLIRVFDFQGREIHYLDDTPALKPDLHWRHMFTEGGDYWIELRDASYRGGRDSFYRLRIGQFPLATLAFPTLITSNTAAAVVPLGAGTAPPPPCFLKPTASQPHQYAVFRFSPSNPGTALPVWSSPREVVRAMSSYPPTAVEIQVPTVLHGRFTEDHPESFYRLELKKDQSIRLEASSRRWGSPCDIWMQIEDLNGSVLARPKIDDALDTVLNFRAPNDGHYLLKVEEMNRLLGPDYIYVIDVRQDGPWFALTLEKDHLEVRPGEVTSLKITAQRRQYDGPILLRAHSPQASEWSAEATLEAKKDEATLRLAVPESWKPGQLLRLQIQGLTTEVQPSFTASASARSVWENDFPNTTFFPFDLDAWLLLAVVP